MIKYNAKYDLYVTEDGNIYWKDLYGNLNLKKQHKNNNGYLFVNRNINSTKKKLRVHRIVAETFIPNPDNKPEIDHINRVRTDNRVDNLRWVTRSENLRNRSKFSKQRKRRKSFKLKYHSEFGKLFFEKYGIQRSDNVVLYQREYAYYRYHNHMK